MGIDASRIMAFDWGLRQIGVAVGNRLLGTSEPLTAVRARDGAADWAAIAALIDDWQPDLLLVGEPLHMDGTDSPMAGRARKFSRQLHGRFGLPVILVDERLSSRAAKSDALERGHHGHWGSAPIDANAANIILCSWLAQQNRKSNNVDK